MKHTRYKALAVLLAAGAGTVISAPYTAASLTGGLIHSGCLAAVVGGLADWFAVTALFRRPLGIPWRTAVIPRNRERIFQDLVSLVETDLLNQENIRRTLAQYQVAAVLLEYLEAHQGRRDQKEVVMALLLDAGKQVDERELAARLQQLIARHAAAIPLTPIVAQLAAWTLRKGYVDAVCTRVVIELQAVVAQPQMHAVLSEMFAAVQQAYQNNVPARQLAMDMMGFSPAAMASMAQQQLTQFLQELQEPEHSWRQKGRQWLAQFIERMPEQTEVCTYIEQWKQHLLAEQLDLSDFVGRYLQTCKERLSHADETGGLEQVVDQWVDQVIDQFAQNPKRQQIFSEWGRERLEELVARYHGQIAVLVRSRLHELSNAMLVEFIEDKVGDDLQMIRINGSLVGGVVGMLLYGLHYVLERMW